MIYVTASIFTIIGFIAGILVAGRSRAELETRIIELESLITGAKINYQILKDIYDSLLKRYHILLHTIPRPNAPNDLNDEK